MKSRRTQEKHMLGAQDETVQYFQKLPETTGGKGSLAGGYWIG